MLPARATPALPTPVRRHGCASAYRTSAHADRVNAVVPARVEAVVAMGRMTAGEAAPKGRLRRELEIGLVLDRARDRKGRDGRVSGLSSLEGELALGALELPGALGELPSSAEGQASSWAGVGAAGAH